MSNHPHRLTATHNGFDSIGLVYSLDGEDQPTMFSIMTASGPIEPIYKDRGPIEKGQRLSLPYNYETDEYATLTGGWMVEVIRVNRKSVTVKAMNTGKTYRVEFAL